MYNNYPMYCVHWYPNDYSNYTTQHKHFCNLENCLQKEEATWDYSIQETMKQNCSPQNSGKWFI